MGHVERHPGALFAQVEHGEALQEELAEDDPFVEAVEAAAADAPGELLQGQADALFVARVERAEPVAQYDPVDRPAAIHGAALPPFPDGLAVDARAEHARRRAADPGEQVEIDEAVVDRRDQDIGAGNRVAGQRIVGAGTIEHDRVVRRGQPVDQGVGLAAFRGPFRRAAGDAVMLRQVQAQALAPSEIAAVLDIAGERALMAVQIDARHRPALAQQGDDQMHRRRRLAGAALLVAEHDDRAGAAAAVSHTN